MGRLVMCIVQHHF